MTHATIVEQAWAAHRRRIGDVAYRLLGSVHDSEDIVQETYARFVSADTSQIDDVLGWLITAASRLCIDRLRAHEHLKRAYVGPWLPEPVVADPTDVSADDRITLDESVRMALMVVLEQLSVAERTAFILHDIFAVPFDQVGSIVGRSPQACRQLASRARRHLDSEPTTKRFSVDRDVHAAVVRRFADAIETGNLAALIAVLDPDVVGDFDSGGVIPGAPTRELHGAAAVARQLIRALSGRGATFETVDVNGDPGLTVAIAERIVAVIATAISNGRIHLIHAVGNPAKLAHLNPLPTHHETQTDLSTATRMQRSDPERT
jgi:RNA polymerase sigma-70 factor (ECF subfamily)